jgi:Large eukaryotic DNA virus major capsid protein/Major capsid protein N-terminus
MQLVAFGAQDVYLSGQPKVTYFQAAYKRHTNFAMEAVQQTVQGAGGNGGLFSVTLSRSGDLVGDMWVSLVPTPSSASQLTSNNVGSDMCWVAERAFSTIELFIGGQLIDKHYQLWFRLYSEVFLGDTKKMDWGRLTSLPLPSNTGTSIGRVYLPLLFFFNRNPGLALPLVALQYHEVRIDFTLTNYFSNYFGTNPIEVWANYMYLEESERGRFSKNNHEYLIEQVQKVGGGDPVVGSSENAPAVVRLQFNHPVKELIWCYQDPSPLTNRNALWNFSSSTANVNVTVDTNKIAQAGMLSMPNQLGVPRIWVPSPLSSNLYVSATTGSVVSGVTIVAGSSIAFQSNVAAGNVFWVESGVPSASTNVSFGYEVGPLHKFKILLNGTERAAEQYGKYFNQYQPFQYHSGSPYPGIYVYSFALKPEEHQPSGACNFSRIDMAQVAVSLKTGMPSNLLQQMFAVNYNVLRIASGLGGLAFSN